MTLKIIALRFIRLMPLLFWSNVLFSLPSGYSGVYLLPLNCAELLPDSTPFIQFFEGVGRSSVLNEPKFARRIFRLLSFREKLAEERPKDQNPVDNLIRKTLCFYREQREPLKAVTISDEKFLSYLRASLKELENKVEEAAFQVELEKQEKAEYERRVKGHEGKIEKIYQEVDHQVENEFRRISQSAKRKVTRGN